MGKVIAVIIIILLILGAYLIFRGGEEAGAPGTEDRGSEATVTYRDSGFSPRTIRIESGDTITFFNDSSEGMWVASDPHPTHALYPDFDQRASVPNGSSWSYTFERTGSWDYHNDENASSTGTVLVEPRY